MTAWASHHEVGFCRTPTHTSPFERTARRLPHATAASRGSGDALAVTDDAPPVCAERATEAQNYNQAQAPQRDREGCRASASSPSLTPNLLWRPRSVWVIGDPGTATDMVHIFSRITRDDVGVVCFSPYSAARLYTSPCPSPSSAPARFGSNDRLREKPGSR